MSNKHQCYPRANGCASQGFALQSFSSERMALTSLGAASEPDEALWEADAIHRAKNLAQLASSMAQVGPDRLGLKADAGFRSKAEALASAYSELSMKSRSASLVPCAHLLERVSTGLTDIFREQTTVVICYQLCDVFLAPDRRRSLVLIASELVINGLKYAFPDARAGTIGISLAQIGDCARLVVEDDGVGFHNLASAGTGSRLIAAMSDFLHGRIERGNCTQGGARVALWLPLRVGAC